MESKFCGGFARPERLARIPVVVLTSSDSPRDRIAGQ